MKVAAFLESHPAVKKVIYPGLISHPHHELAGTQMSGFGGMISIELKGGLSSAISLSEKIKVFTYSTSLGHAHSLLFFYPTDLYVDAATYLTDQQKISIRKWAGEGIVRISVGLENADDLIRDLDQALHGRTLRGTIGPLAYNILKNKKG